MPKNQKFTLEDLLPEGVTLQDNTRYQLNENEREVILLEKARTYWTNLDKARRVRRYNRNFYLGHQYLTAIKHPETGAVMSEEEYIIEQGRTPISNNQIAQIRLSTSKNT